MHFSQKVQLEPLESTIFDWEAVAATELAIQYINANLFSYVHGKMRPVYIDTTFQDMNNFRSTISAVCVIGVVVSVFVVAR